MKKVEEAFLYKIEREGSITKKYLIDVTELEKGPIGHKNIFISAKTVDGDKVDKQITYFISVEKVKVSWNVENKINGKTYREHKTETYSIKSYSPEYIKFMYANSAKKKVIREFEFYGNFIIKGKVFCEDNAINIVSHIVSQNLDEGTITTSDNETLFLDWLSIGTIFQTELETLQKMLYNPKEMFIPFLNTYAIKLFQEEPNLRIMLMEMLYRMGTHQKNNFFFANH